MKIIILAGEMAISMLRLIFGHKAIYIRGEYWVWVMHLKVSNETGFTSERALLFDAQFQPLIKKVCMSFC